MKTGLDKLIKASEATRVSEYDYGIGPGELRSYGDVMGPDLSGNAIDVLNRGAGNLLQKLHSYVNNKISANAAIRFSKWASLPNIAALFEILSSTTSTQIAAETAYDILARLPSYSDVVDKEWTATIRQIMTEKIEEINQGRATRQANSGY